MADTTDPNEDAETSLPSGPAPSTARAREYDRLPWYRKSGVCSGIIVAHLVVGVIGNCLPIVGLLGLVTTMGVIAVCISALTGPIYYDKRGKDGTLKSWSWGNKIAAVIILILFIGGYMALMWYLVTSGQFAFPGGGRTGN